MKTLSTTAAAIVLALAGVAPSWAAEVIVIAHPGVQLSAEEVRDVFVGEKQLAAGVKLVPLDNSAVQGEFLQRVIKVEAGKYLSIWTKKGFRDGLAPPALRASDQEIIAAVKSTPGAIGYVSKASAEVKVIQRY